MLLTTVEPIHENRKASLRQRDFVFVGLRALLSPLGAADPRGRRFKVWTIFFFGTLLAFFLIVDRVSLSSYRWPEGFFLLVYLAVAVFATLFRFYGLVFDSTKIGSRLRASLHPLERLPIHLALAAIAVGLQIWNYRNAKVDVTFGSHRLSTFLGVTTSATGWYEIFGASLLTYCGFVLLLKLTLIYVRFRWLFERSLTKRRDRVDAMATLLSLNVVVLTSILVFGLYLLCWRTGGFDHVVHVNGSFFADLIVLVVLTFFACAFTVRSRRLLENEYRGALAKYLAREDESKEAPWLLCQAPAWMFLAGYALFYSIIGLVTVLVVVAYTAPDFVNRLLSYTNPLLSTFGVSPVALLAVFLITSRFDRFSDHVAADYRQLERPR